YIRERAADACRLLFVGVDWRRKGGDIALAVAEELRRRGLPAELEIVGCVPPRVVPGFVRVHPFVSKKTLEGRALMAQLYQRSHFLLLPTRAEAYGVAFVEACAHGVPCMGSSVGGVTTIIKDGVNGRLLPLEAPPALYADRIQSLWQDPQSYRELCRSAFRTTQSRLSWTQFGNTVRGLVETL
ncbi:MAG TPA: glycosyltransferase family 4 protein, partial [Rhizomicrobium sp.]|nr:glycosyltransferase family 4 protein [Rhizomicrobium sp.]